MTTNYKEFPNTSYWTLEESIEICRMLEVSLRGVEYHVALGGSVLFKGESQKDLDIFIYPRYKNQKKKLSEVFKILNDLGFLCLRNQKETRELFYYEDIKHIEIWKFRNKRVDFFFVE